MYLFSLEDIIFLGFFCYKNFLILLNWLKGIDREFLRWKEFFLIINLIFLLYDEKYEVFVCNFIYSYIVNKW